MNSSFSRVKTCRNSGLSRQRLRFQCISPERLAVGLGVDFSFHQIFAVRGIIDEFSDNQKTFETGPERQPCQETVIAGKMLESENKMPKQKV